MTTFKLPEFNENQPLREHPMVEWLKVNCHYEDRKSTIDIQCDYLDSLGFITGKDKAPESFFKITGYVIDSYVRGLCAGGGELFNIGDLFCDVGWKGTKSEGFTCRDLGYNLALSDVLVSLIDKTSAIYPLEPEYYYFEVINGRLHMRYQQILGGRKICLVGV